MGRPYGTASGWCLVNCKSLDERVGEKILPCNLGLKSEAEIWVVPMGLQVLNAWLDAKVWINGRRKNFAL
jgi:hypothetical protein